MRYFVTSLIASLLLNGVALGQIVNGTPPDKRPTNRTLDCTNAGCHAKQIEHKVLHGPNAVKACDACHEYADPAAHTFALKRQGADLCEFCHIDKSGREGAFVHEPVKTGACTGCHDPHGAESRTLLKAESTPALCVSCHKETMTGQHKHGPAAADCTACHRAHTSDHAKLLTMEKQALCTSCHEDVGKGAKGVAHPHEPAVKDCLACHTPHSSNQAKVLKLPMEALCASCHQKTVDTAAHASHTHGALTDAKACMNCHVPHGSDFDKQLSQDPVGACLQCHAKPIEVSGKRTVAGVPEIGNASLHKHGAIEKGDCSGCHTVHGGERDRLLVANYNNTFYQTFSDTAYALCFKCHSKELVMGAGDDPQTRFRDGGRNLHAMHVTAGGKQGRNCRSCHAIHASKFTQLINENVPFGSWKLPINFIPNPTGGSCSPGCHEPQKYDRSKPRTAGGLPSLFPTDGSPEPAKTPAAPGRPGTPAAPAAPVAIPPGGAPRGAGAGAAPQRPND